MSEPEFRIKPWAEDDLPLLEKLMGDPAMTENLGGPESPEKIAERQKRYERLPGTGKGRMFKIVETPTGESAGSVGYWVRESSEGQVYETGWMVLPAFQASSASCWSMWASTSIRRTAARSCAATTGVSTCSSRGSPRSICGSGPARR